MTDRGEARTAQVLMDVEEAAKRLGTKPRFIRRLIAERRIEYHKVGRHVRISEAGLTDFFEAGKVAPMEESGVWRVERMPA